MVRLTYHGLDGVGLGAVFATAGPGRIHVDLAQLTFIEPYALVAILTCAQGYSAGGAQLVVTPPRQWGPASYCQRVDLFAQLRNLGAISPDPYPGQGRHNRHDTMAECVRVQDGASVNQLGNVMTHQLDSAGWPAVVTDTLTAAVYEMGDNLITHARIDHGFAVLQTFPQQGRFQFAVGDAGVGIPFHHPAENDAISIEQAMEYGVSSYASKRGRGFQYMCELVSQVGGTLTVRSNGGKVVVPAASESLSMLTWPLQGTVVSADVPLER